MDIIRLGIYVAIGMTLLAVVLALLFGLLGFFKRKPNVVGLVVAIIPFVVYGICTAMTSSMPTPSTYAIIYTGIAMMGLSAVAVIFTGIRSLFT